MNLLRFHSKWAFPLTQASIQGFYRCNKSHACLQVVSMKCFSSYLPSEKKKTTIRDIRRIYEEKKERITMITAADYCMARHIDALGFDILLVGDSLGMVSLGYKTTLPVTLEDMIHHTKAVVRGAHSPFIVTDMPFGSSEGSPHETLKNAMRIIKEGGADAVKIEGGRNRACAVKTIVDAGIPVMGHIGLQPQMFQVLGGFRAQGRTAIDGKKIIEDSLRLQDAGAFSLVMECVPPVLAKEVTRIVNIPTIGIGAGPHTSGQVLVLHDLLDLGSQPRLEQRVPRFCKRYAAVGNAIFEALQNYRDDVRGGRFPSDEYTHFKMSDQEANKFREVIEEYDGFKEDE